MKCWACKKEKSEDEFGLAKNGKKKLTMCKVCHAKITCIHDKQKRYCKDCKGAGICSHGKQKTHCTECEGSHKCTHGNIKHNCIIPPCHGGNRCIHKAYKFKCVLCNPDIKCVHKKEKYNCKICHPIAFCKCGKRKDLCKLCKGKGICEHDKIRCMCEKCGGSSLCIHGRRNDQCKECGTAFCKHNSWSNSCIKCHPNRACKECKEVLVRKSSKFHPYCSPCYATLFPDSELVTTYRLKEAYFFKAVQKAFPEEELIFNKTVGDSKVRPDIFIRKETYCIGIENDENMHSGETSCDRALRNHKIWEDSNYKPLIMIRFNPDSYEVDDEKFVSCFSFDEKKMSVDEEEWNNRFEILQETIEICLNNPPTEKITEHFLFYTASRIE